MKVQILFYIAFKVLKVLYIIFFIIQSPVLLLFIALHQVLHQQIFHNFVRHYLKQDIFKNIPFIKRFTQPQPLPSLYYL